MPERQGLYGWVALSCQLRKAGVRLRFAQLSSGWMTIAGLSDAEQLKTCPSLLMIGAAKEPDMDEQRPQPIDGLAVFPALGEAAGVVKYLWRLVEQPQHGKIDLAVAIIACRVDQPADTVLTDKDIATPQIAMEEG